MSDRQGIQDELREAADAADSLKDKIDELHSKIEDDLRTVAEAADEIIFDLEGDEADQPYDAETDELENATWAEGWQACIDRIRTDYGS